MKQSMKEKISFHLFIVGMASVLLSASLTTALFHRVFTKQIQHDLALTASDIAAAYDFLPSPSELFLFDNEEIRITLISANGKVIYESDTNSVMENHLTRPEVQAALKTGEGFDERTSSTMGYTTYYYALLLEDGTVLRTAIDVENLYSIYNEALPAVMISCIFILILSALLSLFLTRRIVRPIEKMADDLDNIGDTVPYIELEPFAKAIQQDQQTRKSSEKLRREFTANVSHELKTPLTSISGYAELIETGIAKPEDVKSFAARIRKESTRLLRLIGDIIKLSELDSADGEPQLAAHFEDTDLLTIARECVNDLQVSAQKSYITLLCEGSSAKVQADPGLITELCTNLCDNSIRYNHAGGKVVVSVQDTPEGAVLSVRDNGIGIPTEHQQRVFERFYRVDKSRSKATGGTGLGLAIVKHIAMLHGAKISLSSTPGEGTLIRVIFPHHK